MTSFCPLRSLFSIDEVAKRFDLLKPLGIITIALIQALFDNDITRRVSHLRIQPLAAIIERARFWHFSWINFTILVCRYAQYGDVSPKVDVFAFGVVLYELISAKDAIIKPSDSMTESKGLVALVSFLASLYFADF